MKTLQEIYQSYSNPKDYGDKGTSHSYIDTYASLFEPIRTTATNVIEIGCFHGHSLRMWREYFPVAQIDSIEIFPELCFEEDRIKVYNGDSVNPELASNFKDEYYDVIIDDGSHRIEDQTSTLKLYFSKLKKGGIYVIEDVLHVSDELRQFHPSYTLYDLNHERGLADNRLVAYKK